MAASRRNPNSDLESGVEDLLKAHPGAFNFFQAVRLIQRFYPNKPTVGGFVSPAHEAVRFSVNNALSFPPCEIVSIDWNKETVEMAVAFMGLTGHSGVLPYCYSELILERQRAKDNTAAAFFDLFSGRMIALFYRAWEKYRIPVAFERAYLRAREVDKFAEKLLSLVGLGTPGLQNKLPVNEQTLVYFAGLLSAQPRSATALRKFLEGYFDVPVEIEEFVGCWRRLEPADLCILNDVDRLSEQLGVGAVVGDEIWDQQSRIRVRIGPLSQERYREFLPTGNAHEALRALLDFFSNREFEFELQLVLKQAEVPACELGIEGDGATPLGWLTWMKSSPQFSRNADDTVLLLN